MSAEQSVDADSQEREFSSRCGKIRDTCRYLLLGL